MTTAAPIRSLEQVHTYVMPAIRSLLERLDSRNRLVASYQLGFWDAAGTPSRRNGKGLRPALALLSARAAGGSVEVGVPAAASVELAHNFSLLHDDVMDGDSERRHRPTAWAIFGAGPAILAGDALLTLAEEMVASAPGGGVAAARLRADIRRLIAGQAADLDFERREVVTLDECLQMSADKTAALLSCSCALGAMLCGGPPALVAGLSRFGTRFGLAFQLVDDLLGIWGDPRRTGKPVGADLRARKKSVPVVWAIGSGTAAGQQLGQLYGASHSLSDEEVVTTARLVEESGARDWTRQRADQELAAAMLELRELSLPEPVHEELSELAAFGGVRDH
jgi:geranylgeranyl diphosphate synthase type I